MSEQNDIDILYGKVQKLDTRVTKLESIHPFIEEMVQKNTAIEEKLTETMNSVQISIVKMGEKIDRQSSTIESIKKDVIKADEKLTEKFQKVEKRIDTIEGKGKFDILLYIKENWPLIIIILGLGITYASDYIKV